MLMTYVSIKLFGDNLWALTSIVIVTTLFEIFENQAREIEIDSDRVTLEIQPLILLEIY